MASNEVEIPGSVVAVDRLKEIAARRSLSRRHFVTALGLSGAAAGAELLTGCSSATVTPATSVSIGQTDVLNFALNLEFLEATFYAFVTTGADLPASLVPNSGAVTGAPAQLVFTGANAQQITDMLNEIYFDEKNHVINLQSLLSSSVVFRPAINLAAAGAITASNALSIARLFEDVGVTAYAGAAPALSNSSLTIASQLLGVESEHAGMLRLVAIQNPGIAAYVAADSLDVRTADPGSAAVAAAGPTTSGAFFATAGASSATASTPAGFAFARTTSQVLAILYGSGGTPASSGTSSGGFFPNGVNGKINTV